MNPAKEKSYKLKRRLLSFLVIFCFVICMIPAGMIRAAGAKTLNPSVDTVLTNVGNYILSVDTNPDYSSIWNVIGMVRSGKTVPSSYVDNFYNNTVNYLENNGWQLSKTKYSDYSKLIIGMTAIGKDARDIDGHNFLEYLSDFSKVKLQGFNGPIWALIALNCHPDYEIPLDLGASEQTTEEGLIQYLLGRETSKGGWTLYGDTPDTDITGMTIQALAPYYGERKDVTSAVDRALTWMSSAQNSEGGYSTLNGNSTSETSESDAQVIVALCSLGIDPAGDNRFVQSNGKWVLSRLFEYYISAGTNKGGFMHIFSGADDNGGGAAGTLNGMATEQGMYATAAYKRLLTGKTALYDMSDVSLSSGEAADPSAVSTQKTISETTRAISETTSSGSAQSEQTAAAAGKNVKVTRLTLNYKQITLQRGKTRTLKLKLYPTNATNKKVKWTSSNKKVATVTQEGKVKGIKAGKADITVTARDGSNKKTLCKVIVKNPSASKNSKSSGSATGSSPGGSRQSVGGNRRGAVASTVQPGGNTGSVSSDNSQGSSGSANGQRVPGTSGLPSGAPGNSTATDDSTQASTEAGAWSFDGDAYVPESSGSSEDTGLLEPPEEEDLSDSEEDESAEDYEDIYEEDESRLSPWLSILLGFLVPGGLAGSFKVPWQTVEDKVLLFAEFRKGKR